MNRVDADSMDPRITHYRLHGFYNTYPVDIPRPVIQQGVNESVLVEMRSNVSTWNVQRWDREVLEQKFDSRCLRYIPALGYSMHIVMVERSTSLRMKGLSL
jgi:hypothetical protein